MFLGYYFPLKYQVPKVLPRYQLLNFWKKVRGNDDFQLINFEDPILDRIIHHTLIISNIPQKLAIFANIAICGQGHIYHSVKGPWTINCLPNQGPIGRYLLNSLLPPY